MCLCVERISWSAKHQPFAIPQFQRGIVSVGRHKPVWKKTEDKNNFFTHVLQNDRLHQLLCTFIASVNLTVFLTLLHFFIKICSQYGISSCIAPGEDQEMITR